MSQPVGNKPCIKRAWSGSRDQVYNFTPKEISSERLKLQTSNFVHSLATNSTNLQITNCPLSGAVAPRDAFYNFTSPQMYLKRRWSWSRQILCACRLCQMLAFGQLIIPERGVARVIWSI